MEIMFGRELKILKGAVDRQRLDVVSILNGQINRYRMKQEKHIVFSDPWLQLREIVRVLEETRDVITNSFEEK
jgi:hypothetical protein